MMQYLKALCLMTFTFQCLASAKEDVYDAARIARSLIIHSANSVGSMATTFPADDAVLPGQPFSFPEYYASCHQNGSLTLLFLPISRHSRNILRSQGKGVSISITSPTPLASHPRVSLVGNVTIFKDAADVPNIEEVRQCYLGKHPDSRWWLPDDDDAAHISYWARFDPHTIYFVGGFGDEHYIGYIPLTLYQNVPATIGDAGNVEDDQSNVMETVLSK